VRVNRWPRSGLKPGCGEQVDHLGRVHRAADDLADSGVHVALARALQELWDRWYTHLGCATYQAGFTDYLFTCTDRVAMTPENRNQMREYAWKYFSHHADQRLKTFNFYLLLVTVVFGGLLAYLKDAKVPALAAPVGLLLSFVSLVFWKLDRRNRDLIVHSEAMLKQIEVDIPDSEVPATCRLFGNEEQQTSQVRQDRRINVWNPFSWFRPLYTYSDCFRAIFWVIGIIGVAIATGVFFYRRLEDAPAAFLQQNFFITKDGREGTG